MTCMSALVPSDVGSKVGELLFDGLHYNIIMLAPATNKSGITPQVFQRLSQPDLHAKILNLVANRMQPASSVLTLQKQACGSCVTPSPAATTKRNSLAGTRDGKARVNQTMCEGYASLK